MRGLGPRGAGRRRPPDRGADSPSTPASLAGCYSAPRRAPLWTCLLLCAALRTLLASPSNEGSAVGGGGAVMRGGDRGDPGGGARRGLGVGAGARWTRLLGTKSPSWPGMGTCGPLPPAFPAALRCPWLCCLTRAAGALASNLPVHRGWLGGGEGGWGSWEVGSRGSETAETLAGRLGATGAHRRRGGSTIPGVEEWELFQETVI